VYKILKIDFCLRFVHIGKIIVHFLKYFGVVAFQLWHIRPLKSLINSVDSTPKC